EPPIVKIKADRVEHWMKNGAKPTETVRTILKKAGLKLV
ncbi:MAG: 30S ribosomal protein S16, partial [Candidatus Omnitrophica bacterium]|nr:30S ribosomal protein S16 [Candidatus Omnitrophota bacterium]